MNEELTSFARLALCAMFTLQAVVSGIIASVSYRRRRAKYARYYRTQGHVVEVKEDPGDGGQAIRHPLIRYRHRNGEEATVRAGYGSSSWSVKPGDPIELLAHEDKPAEAEMVHFLVQWGLPALMSATAVVSLILVLVFYFFVEHIFRF